MMFAVYTLIVADEQWWPIAVIGVLPLWGMISSGKRLFSAQVAVDPRISELDLILTKGMKVDDAIDIVRTNHRLVALPRYYTHSIELEVRGVIFEIFMTDGVVTDWTAK
jgi:hypothetical protein